jgi:RluA family pseudouridine synthase
MNRNGAHIVPPGTPPERFSDYAFRVFTVIPSRKGVRKAIARGAFTLDGVTAETGMWVMPGQVIELAENDSDPRPDFRLRLDVVHQDDHLALINKPAGVPVNGNAFKTVENALRPNLAPSTAADALRRPLPVHRLDSATSGLLIIAKTARAQAGLGRLFEERRIAKRYRALLIGRLEGSGEIDTPIDGRNASTHYAALRHGPSLRSGWLTLVECEPRTGRTHQIRRHFSQAGHPVLGDPLYGVPGLVLKSKGLFLCAVEVSFAHPVTGETVRGRIEEPAKFSTFLERERRRWDKYRA